MTRQHDVITLEMTAEARELMPDAATEYFRASFRVVPFLQECVIKPVETALKRKTGFSDTKLPRKSPHIAECTIDDVVFTLTTTRALKTPSLQEVYNSLNAYLAFLREETEGGKRLPGVVDVNEKLFVRLSDILDHITEFRERVLREGISQSLKHEAPDRYQTDDDRLVVPLRNYSDLGPGSGEMYVRALRFVKRAKERTINPFENALCAATGYSKRNIPAQTVDAYRQVGPHFFWVQNIPSDNPSYGAIINALVYETPTKKVTKKTGELVLVCDGVDDPRVRIYRPEMRGGAMFISLDGLQERIEQLTEEHTGRELRQPIHPYPVV